MKLALKVVVILVGVPLVMYAASIWINFWIHRTIGDWLACGVGIPAGVIMSILLISWGEV